MFLNNKHFNRFIQTKLKERTNAQDTEPVFDPPVSPSLKDNELALKNIFYGTSDLYIRYFTVKSSGTEGFAAYLDELTDSQLLTQNVLEPLINRSAGAPLDAASLSDFIHVADRRLVNFCKVCEETHLASAAGRIVEGHTAVFIENQERVLLVDVQKKAVRDIAEPSIESTVWGPKQAFVENAKLSISMVRNIVRSPKLVVEKFPPGTEIKTELYLVFLAGTASVSVLDQVRHRLSKIDTKLILDSGYIQQYLSERHSSPFPTTDYTERPDKVAARVMEGKVAVFCEGSPFAVIVPLTFNSVFQTVEDYYLPPFFGSFSRMLRHMGFWLSMLAAPLYVALTTYHQQMIPLILLIRASSSREGIPFPAFIEAVIMLITFDLLREAGIRAPKPVGQTISFIGALILGQAAVQAGIVSAPMVIIVSITGVATLLNYHLKNANVMLRYLLLIAGAVLGVFGIEIVLLLILIRLCSIESFGIPYLSPLAPMHAKGLKDVFFRLPLIFTEYATEKKK